MHSVDDSLEYVCLLRRISVAYMYRKSHMEISLTLENPPPLVFSQQQANRGGEKGNGLAIH